MGLCGAAESFNPEVTAVIPAPRWEKSDSYRLCDKGRADLINNKPPIFTVAPQAWLVPDNLSALSIPLAIPASFSSTLKRGIMHQAVLFTGQKSPESGKKTNPSAVSRAGYKQCWLKHKLEVRKGKGGSEEHIETQTTRGEFIDLRGAVGLGGEELLHLREA